MQPKAARSKTQGRRTHPGGRIFQDPAQALAGACPGGGEPSHRSRGESRQHGLLVGERIGGGVVEQAAFRAQADDAARTRLHDLLHGLVRQRRGASAPPLSATTPAPSSSTTTAWPRSGPTSTADGSSRTRGSCPATRSPSSTRRPAPPSTPSRCTASPPPAGWGTSISCRRRPFPPSSSMGCSPSSTSPIPHLDRFRGQPGPGGVGGERRLLRVGAAPGPQPPAGAGGQHHGPPGPREPGGAGVPPGLMTTRRTR